MKADVVVVGAGVVGCLIAAELVARAPRARVVVVDKGMVGGGASRLSAGLHFPRGASERVRTMASYSQRYYGELRRRVPNLPVHSLGMRVISSDEASVGKHYLPEANLARVASVAGIRLPRGSRVWQGDGCQYANVGALTEMVASGLRARVQFWEGTAVLGLDSTADAVELRLSTGAHLTAGRVVLAPGPWLGWSELATSVGARIKKVVALHVARRPTSDDRVVVLHDEDAFLLPLAARGHWLFSYTSPDWDVSPDSLSRGLSEVDLTRGREILHRYAPGLTPSCSSGRVFCDAYSADGAPVVRPLTENGRVLFAGAANGSGYRLGPAIAAETAHLLTEEL